jgi:hypothetical protein
LASQVADTVSWLGNVAERRGDLVGAQRLFGEQVFRLAALRNRYPSDFRRLAEWANAQEVLAASWETTGRYDESRQALANAESAFKTLTKHDPENVPWRVSMASVQIRRAADALAANNTDRSARLLAVAMDSLGGIVSPNAAPENRQINRVLSRGWLLRARVARHRDNLRVAIDAANRSLVETRKEMAKGTVDDVSLADQADALLLLGTVQHAQSPDTYPPAWIQSRELLATRAPNSHYWRLLDPWLRVCLLTGDDAGAHVALVRLNVSGYVPLQPWPVASDQPSPTPEGDQHVH